MGTQQFCLKWNNHHSNMLNVFEHLLTSEALVDVTLACEGLSLKAHKMVLSACSPFFQSLFLENPCKHPIVILKDMRYTDLKAIIDFMYRGEVNVSQNQLSALLKTAETLKVKGLAEVSSEDGQPNGSGIVQQEVIQTVNNPVPGSATSGSGGVAQVTTTPSNRAESPPLSRRKRGRPRRRSLSDSNRSDSEDQVPPAKRGDTGSPDIIEDRDMDTNSSAGVEVSNSVQRLTLPSQTQVQTHSQSQQESRLTIDEVVSGDEVDFVEPSKLMEQSMTTENVPVFPDAQSTGSSMSPASTQRLMLSSSTSLVDSRSLGQSISDSQAQVPVSLSSELSVAGHSSQDIPEDIKPTGLVSYEEPPISPVAGPSHHSQDSSSAMMMYMDSSGVPSIPGPSNYQPDKSNSQLQTQPTQDVRESLPVCVEEALPVSSVEEFLAVSIEEALPVSVEALPVSVEEALPVSVEESLPVSVEEFLAVSVEEFLPVSVDESVPVPSVKEKFIIKPWKVLSTKKKRIKKKYTKKIEVLYCQICDAKFTNRAARNRHQQIQHIPVGRHTCSVCGREFKRKDARIRHEFRVHKIRLIGKIDNGVTFTTEPSLNITKDVKKTTVNPTIVTL